VFIFVFNVLMSFNRNRDKRKAEEQNSDMGDEMKGPEQKNRK
jgi:hypothetical protein